MTILAPLIALAITPQVPQLPQVEAVLQEQIMPSGGSPEAAFGRVADLAVDGDGNTYVLDDLANRVLVFSPAGAHLRTFGRSGRDPGELNRPIRIDVRDTVVTVLNPSAQTTSYTLAGDVLTSRQLPRGARSATRIDEQTYAVLTSGGIARQDPEPIESLLLVGPEEADTVLTIPSSDVLFQGPSSTSAVRTSLCRQAYFVASPEGELWVASGIDGTLTEWRFVDGAAEPGRSAAVAPVGSPLPDSLLAQVLDGLPRQLSPETGDLYLPSVLSSICGLEVSSDGTLWVKLGDGGGSERWRGIDVETLQPTVEVTAPEGVRLDAFSPGLAYGTWADESGTPHVMVYTIE